MKKIKLTQNKYALIDDEDFEWLSRWKWYVNTKGYVARTKHLAYKNGKSFNKQLRMHRIIINTPKEMQTDHINGNKLDNRKHNLRICNNSQNHMNAGKRKDNTSGYKGISWHKSAKKWEAYITANKRRIYLGIYSNIEKAVKVRKRASAKYHGDFARV